MHTCPAAAFPAENLLFPERPLWESATTQSLFSWNYVWQSECTRTLRKIHNISFIYFICFIHLCYRYHYYLCRLISALAHLFHVCLFSSTMLSVFLLSRCLSEQHLSSQAMASRATNNRDLLHSHICPTKRNRMNGLSTNSEPSKVETLLTWILRHWILVSNGVEGGHSADNAKLTQSDITIKDAKRILLGLRSSRLELHEVGGSIGDFLDSNKLTSSHLSPTPNG